MTTEELIKITSMLHAAGYNINSRLEEIPLGVLMPMSSELTWGTFGESGKGPLRYKLLSELSTSHLRNILVTQTGVAPLVRAVIMSVFEYRLRSGLEWPAEGTAVTELSEAEISVNSMLDSMLGDEDAKLV